MRSRLTRTDAGLTSLQIAFIAVGAALVLLVGYVIFFLVSGGSGGDSGTPTPTGSASPGATTGPSPTATTPAYADWGDVPPGDRPPFIAGRSGEPAAREWAPWVLDLVDDTWDAEIWCDPNPATNTDAPPDQTADRCLYQALYLDAPDGEKVRVFELRTDLWLTIAATAMDEGIIWIDRLYYESIQTVEFDLSSGTVDENWAHDGFTNVTAPYNQEGWFVFHSGTLSDGTMVWEGSGYAEPLHGVFFRAPGGAITPSAISPHFGGTAGEPYCLGVDPDDAIAIYESYEYAEGQPVANWPATLVKHDLQADTWTTQSRLGPYGTPCHDDFDLTPTYYVGLANRVDQSGLYRYFFDGSPDQAVP